MAPEEKLEAIVKIYETVSRSENGTLISSHARHNLAGALWDLKRTGKSSKVIINTIERVIDQLLAIESYLDLSRH